MRMSVVDSFMAGYSSASWANWCARNSCITKDTPPPFIPPSTTFGYTPAAQALDQFRLVGLSPIPLLLCSERGYDQRHRNPPGGTAMSLLDHPDAQALLADAVVTPEQVRGCQDRLTAFLQR